MLDMILYSFKNFVLVALISISPIRVICENKYPSIMLNGNNILIPQRVIARAIGIKKRINVR